MKRTAVRLALFLGSGAVALLVAWLLLGDGFRLSIRGFLVAVIVFTVVQVAISPLVDRLTRRYAAPLIGGVGVISTFLALLVATLFSGGLQIHGLSNWIAATVIVWVVTALATLAAPWLRKKALGGDAGGAAAPQHGAGKHGAGKHGSGRA